MHMIDDTDRILRMHPKGFSGSQQYFFEIQQCHVQLRAVQHVHGKALST